jgi:hypothetical protein
MAAYFCQQSTLKKEVLLMKLSQKQAFSIGRGFKKISNGIGSFHYSNWDTLSRSERRELHELERRLFDYSSDLIIDIVGTDLSEVSYHLKDSGSLERQNPKQVIENILHMQDTYLVEYLYEE